MKKVIAIFGVLLFLMLATTQVTSAGVLPTHQPRDYVVEPHYYDDFITEEEDRFLDCCRDHCCESCILWSFVRLSLQHLHVVI